MLVSSYVAAQAPATGAGAPVAEAVRAAELRATIAGLTPAESPALAEAHNSLGLLHWRESRFDSALVHLRKAQALWTELADTVGLGRSYNNIGATFYQAGHFEPALEAFSRSLALRQYLGDQRGITLVLSNIGTTYLDLQLYDRARPALEAALAAAETQGEVVRGYALHSLGLLHLHTGNHAEARSLLESSMAVYDSIDDPPRRDASSGWSLNAVTLGLLHVQEGDPRGAIALLEPVRAMSAEAGNVRRHAAALLYLGRAWRAMGDLDRATDHLQRSLAISSLATQRMLALEALAELADVHEARGDTRAALARLRAHGALRDSIFSQHTLQRVADMEAREEAQRQEAENTRLLAERQVREAVIARQRIIGLLGGGLLLVSALLVTALVHYNRTGRERERMLTAANTALEHRNSELNAALSEVRTLKGLIPICSNCKKVRDDRGFWEAVETYVSDRSDASFSHSICGDCGPLLYPGAWPDAAAELAGLNTVIPTP
jgi:tetratricopeptide (TPR) repeat protein